MSGEAKQDEKAIAQEFMAHVVGGTESQMIQFLRLTAPADQVRDIATIIATRARRAPSSDQWCGVAGAKHTKETPALKYKYLFECSGPLEKTPLQDLAKAMGEFNAHYRESGGKVNQRKLFCGFTPLYMECAALPAFGYAPIWSSLKVHHISVEEGLAGLLDGSMRLAGVAALPVNSSGELHRVREDRGDLSNIEELMTASLTGLPAKYKTDLIACAVKYKTKFACVGVPQGRLGQDTKLFIIKMLKEKCPPPVGVDIDQLADAILAVPFQQAFSVYGERLEGESGDCAPALTGRKLAQVAEITLDDGEGIKTAITKVAFCALAQECPAKLDQLQLVGFLQGNGGSELVFQKAGSKLVVCKRKYKKDSKLQERIASEGWGHPCQETLYARITAVFSMTIGTDYEELRKYRNAACQRVMYANLNPLKRTMSAPAASKRARC